MQAAKDSFYMALRTRLAAQYPTHTVSMDGVTQPAILVAENRGLMAGELSTDCYWLSFGPAQAARGWESRSPALMTMECTIRYRTEPGQDGSSRGREMGALDTELLAIWSPGMTAKLDYTQTPAIALGSNVSWLRPKLGEATEDNGTLQRAATVEMFFYVEGGA
jgi:hypothetical protein